MGGIVFVDLKADPFVDIKSRCQEPGGGRGAREKGLDHGHQNRRIRT